MSPQSVFGAAYLAGAFATLLVYARVPSTRWWRHNMESELAVVSVLLWPLSAILLLVRWLWVEEDTGADGDDPNGGAYR